MAASYAFVGLSPEGNQDILAMSPESYAEKMERWRRWITEPTGRQGPALRCVEGLPDGGRRGGRH